MNARGTLQYKCRNCEDVFTFIDKLRNDVAVDNVQFHVEAAMRYSVDTPVSLSLHHACNDDGVEGVADLISFTYEKDEPEPVEQEQAELDLQPTEGQSTEEQPTEETPTQPEPPGAKEKQEVIITPPPAKTPVVEEPQHQVSSIPPITSAAVDEVAKAIKDVPSASSRGKTKRKATDE